MQHGCLVNVLQIGPGNDSKLETKIANRLIVSQMVSFATILFLIAIVGIPVLYVNPQATRRVILTFASTRYFAVLPLSEGRWRVLHHDRQKKLA